jgi:hypothetical protein
MHCAIILTLSSPKQAEAQVSQAAAQDRQAAMQLSKD